MLSCSKNVAPYVSSFCCTSFIKFRDFMKRKRNKSNCCKIETLGPAQLHARWRYSRWVGHHHWHLKCPDQNQISVSVSPQKAPTMDAIDVICNTWFGLGAGDLNRTARKVWIAEKVVEYRS